MNRYHVDAFFPEIPSGVARQQVVVEGCRVPVAAYRGMREIMARPSVKGRRIRTIQITIQKVGKVNAGQST